MGFSVIRSGLTSVLLLVTGQSLPAQAAVNRSQIHPDSALNGIEWNRGVHGQHNGAIGFLLRGTTTSSAAIWFSICTMPRRSAQMAGLPATGWKRQSAAVRRRA